MENVTINGNAVDHDHAAFWAEYAAQEKQVKKRNARILRIIKKLKGEHFYRALKKLLHDAEVSGPLAIIRQPDGVPVECDGEYGPIRILWAVDHRAPMGETGDYSYSGSVCIEIKPGEKWLHASYSY